MQLRVGGGGVTHCVREPVWLHWDTRWGLARHQTGQEGESQQASPAGLAGCPVKVWGARCMVTCMQHIVHYKLYQTLSGTAALLPCTTLLLMLTTEPVQEQMAMGRQR